jgi:monothiol glutaredoxin
MTTEEKILDQIKNNPILIYMKGVPDAPQCGFSAKAVALIQSSGVPFAWVDVLNAPFIREKLPKVSKWPTFPQLFVAGELIGGCDIIEELHKNGELSGILKAAAPGETS